MLNEKYGVELDYPALPYRRSDRFGCLFSLKTLGDTRKHLKTLGYFPTGYSPK